MRKCWNCNDPIPNDSDKNICCSCERRMNEEDADDRLVADSEQEVKDEV
jgi:hypothetical protein